jgi:hypothetical protein
MPPRPPICECSDYEARGKSVFGFPGNFQNAVALLMDVGVHPFIYPTGCCCCCCCTQTYTYTHIPTYTPIHIYTYTLGVFGKVGTSSFQGSLYLSRESLGNHFFEGIPEIYAYRYIYTYSIYTYIPTHPLVFMFFVAAFEPRKAI